jgi:predicted nucleic acid-binding Zn ribbon protein
MIPVKKRDKKFLCEQEGCTGVMERDIDMPSFQLKGGGWYKDGYSKKKQKKKQDD